MLDEVVVMVRSLAVRVPKKYECAVVYTQSEITLLRTATPEALRGIHRVKKTVGGTVVEPGPDPFEAKAQPPESPGSAGQG